MVNSHYVSHVEIPVLDVIQAKKWYESIFDGATTQTAIGECTPNYLWITDAPPDDLRAWERSGAPNIAFAEHPELARNIPARVAEWYPDLRIVCIVRNPVDRAISSYLHQIRKRRISPSQGILQAGGSFGILGMGFYHAHLSGWLEFFPQERFLILVYEEDLRDESMKTTLQRVYSHLKVDAGFTPPRLGDRYNTRTGNLMLYLGYYTPRIASISRRVVPHLNSIDWPFEMVSKGERRLLHRLYERDIQRLEDLLDRDLSSWQSTE